MHGFTNRPVGRTSFHPGCLGNEQVVEHLALGHPNLKAANTLDQPDTVVPHANGDALVRDGALSATLRPVT